jgi:hypothetical protein
MLWIDLWRGVKTIGTSPGREEPRAPLVYVNHAMKQFFCSYVLWKT